MKLTKEAYPAQVERWPKTGRHILAQYDEDSIVVYQAYKPSIGHFAAANHYFGGDFQLGRMSWIKTNFLWMMFRSGWGTKPEQAVTLAVRIQRRGFDIILSQAVHSTFVPFAYSDEAEWKAAVSQLPVRLQWDPDHHPVGAKLERRAIQLGLRGDVLARYAREWIFEIEDISDFVAQQYEHVRLRHYAELVTPRETVYLVGDPQTVKRLGIAES